MRMLFPSTVNDKRFHMGWLQLRRWLSFLPAAFVVYILLHYLVYQPDISGPHAVLVTDGRSNSSLVGGAGGRTLQSGPRVLPHLSSDSQDVLQDTPNAPANAATPLASQEESAASPGVAASAAGSEHLQPDDNSTAYQGSGGAALPDTDSPSLARFDSISRPLGAQDPSKEASPSPEESEAVLLRGGGLIGSGLSGAGYGPSGTGSRTGSASRSPLSTGGSQAELSGSASRSPVQDDLRAGPPEGASSAILPPSSSPLPRDAPPPPVRGAIPARPTPLPMREVLSVEAAGRPLPVDPDPPLPPAHALPEYMGRGGLRFDQRSVDYHYPAIQGGYEGEYEGYGQHQPGFSPEMELPRTYYAHSLAMAEMGGLHSPIGNMLPSSYEALGYPDERDQAMGEQPPAQAVPVHQAHPSEGNKPPTSPHEKGSQPQASGAAGHTEVRVSSTVRAVSSSSPSSVATKGAGLPKQPSPAGLAAAQSQPQPPHMVVVEGTGSVPQVRQTKKTTVVKKSNIASSTGLSINALKGKTKVGEKYESGFNVPHEELCPNNGRELKVLVLITTAPDHEKHRTAVRQTWGHFSIRKDVVMAFMIGRTNNPTIQANIDKENELYGDVVQANFIDHYSNLTLKTVSMFEWAKTYCSESHFILKTDDDMFINMPLLLTFIDSKINDRRVMYGRLAKGWKPVRNKKSKYYIDTSTYSKTRYPDFLTGPAYLFTNDVVDDIYQKALGTTFFVLEDVLVTGIVGESLRIKRVGDSRFRNEKIKLTDTCSLMKTISIHMVKYEEQFDIYKRTLDGKAKCKTG
ncbi:TSC22 domain family protein 2-like isoform X2 [Penaeus japonicus]|uniref:TSC22 domain family protein 2-like isoform X2 n=1 Tax=Penaeus japonicus TaxID=27405 RepID=UPI001C713D7B|nr:TSC22 domain family protein 2-like isoform X2 [Penaeus japonicus]